MPGYKIDQHESAIPADTVRGRAYIAWVDAWVSTSTEPRSETVCENIAIEDLAPLFRDENLSELLTGNRVKQVVHAFKRKIMTGQVTLSGKLPPSCEEINILSESYDPRTDCHCNGLHPLAKYMTVEEALQGTQCSAIKKMLHATRAATSSPSKRHENSLFTAMKLENAVSELILSNSDIQPPPEICAGPGIHIPEIKAPDRRPSIENDTESSLYHQWYPTAEKIKLCADAKYFFCISSGGTLVDPGLLLAIADSGNDILIGDYCEAADKTTIALLQKVGGAAVSFLKMCHLAGLITDWSFRNLELAIIQFRVLGYFRDHARPRLPAGIYGSRMTGMTVHRHIDIAIYHGVISASLATNSELTECQYMKLSEACALINDLVDLRSDTMRKQRENVILRGVSGGNVCLYIDGLLVRCLKLVSEVVRDGQLGGLVVMGFCNWAVMASHHKVFELVKETTEVKRYPTCSYLSVEDSWRYGELLEALKPYGSLDQGFDSSIKRRIELDMMYAKYRASPDTHIKWLADMTRSLLEPNRLRRIVDVVHFEWHGGIGDAEYCP